MSATRYLRMNGCRGTMASYGNSPFQKVEGPLSRGNFGSILAQLLGSPIEMTPCNVIVGKSKIHDVLLKGTLKHLGKDCAAIDDLSYFLEQRYESKNKVLICGEIPKLNEIQFGQTVIPAMMAKRWQAAIIIFTEDLDKALDVVSQWPMVHMCRARDDVPEKDIAGYVSQLEKDPEMCTRVLISHMDHH